MKKRRENYYQTESNGSTASDKKRQLLNEDELIAVTGGTDGNVKTYGQHTFTNEEFYGTDWGIKWWKCNKCGRLVREDYLPHHADGRDSIIREWELDYGTVPTKCSIYN
ncbi:MAG: hypothetical protein LBJ95_03180 [Oscillospiraceae bacterium]|jgi:hypothetical protein|nr:hypothetical protein [Oscillospiraceae bacterium]